MTVSELIDSLYNYPMGANVYLVAITSYDAISARKIEFAFDNEEHELIIHGITE